MRIFFDISQKYWTEILIREYQFGAYSNPISSIGIEVYENLMTFKEVWYGQSWAGIPGGLL